MKKSTLVIVAAIFFIACNTKQQSGSNNFAIVDAEKLSANLLSSGDHDRMNTKPYYEGKMQILSIPGEYVITGLDSDTDGKYDHFCFVQTTEGYTINEEIKNGQIIYAQSCFILNDTDTERIYFMTLYPDDERVAAIWKQIPEEIQIMLNGNFIEGVGVGTGTGNTNGFGDIFNNK